MFILCMTIIAMRFTIDSCRQRCDRLFIMIILYTSKGLWKTLSTGYLKNRNQRLLKSLFYLDVHHTP